MCHRLIARPRWTNIGERRASGDEGGEVQMATVSSFASALRCVGVAKVGAQRRRLTAISGAVAFGVALSLPVVGAGVAAAAPAHTRVPVHAGSRHTAAASRVTARVARVSAPAGRANARATSAARMARIVNPPITCTDSWKTAASGAWNTATNWSTGAVPTSTDNVCITVAGTYTVTLATAAQRELSPWVAPPAPRP